MTNGVNPVFDSAQAPFAENQHIAVAIGFVDANQRHVGLLHHDSESNGVRLLHLAWHHRLANDSPTHDYLRVDPVIHPRRQLQVAAICRKVLRANPTGIPYAFSAPNDCFDEATGQFLLGPARHGLTCASFVLAVFHVAGLPLVDYGTWPLNRTGDREWQEQIVAALRGRATPEHVEAVRGEIGSVRFRPEEVAGAATVSPVPVGFEIAADRGRMILERLRSG